jgi:HEAT repeat protein
MGSKAAVLLLWLAPFVQDDKAAEEAIERFKATFNKSPTPDGRASAVSELARVPHEKTMKVLIPLLMGDPMPKVREAAAKALGDFSDYKKAVTPAMIGALSAGNNAKEPDVRAAILASLGKLKDPIAFDLIHKTFRDESSKVAKAAITATGTMRQKESLDPLLELLKDVKKWTTKKQSGGYKDDKGQVGDEAAQMGRLGEIEKAVLAAFQAITKEKWVTAQEWEIWWTKRKTAGWEVPK